jgi:hypothetical protein
LVIDKDARTRRLQASFPCAQRAAWRLRAGFFLHSPGPFRFRVLQQSLSNSASRGPAGSVRLASLLTSIARQFFVRVRSGFVAPLVVLLLLQPRAGRPVVCVRARLPNLWFRARPLIWRVTHPTHASSSWLVPGCESDRSSIEAYPTYLLTYLLRVLRGQWPRADRKRISSTRPDRCTLALDAGLDYLTYATTDSATSD